MATGLPHRNATLTAITAHGYEGDWASASTDGSATWTGTAAAVVVDDTRRESTGSSSSVLVTRSVVLPAALSVNVGDKLTLSWHGTTITPTVKSVVRREPPAGVDGTLLVEVEVT